MFNFRLVDIIALYALVLLTSNAFISLLIFDPYALDVNSDNKLLVNLIFVCYLYVLIRLMKNFESFLVIIKNSIPLLVFFSYLLINAMFSEYRLFAIQKVVALILTAFAACFIVLCFDLRNFINHFSNSLVLLLLSSLFFGLFLPGYGIHFDEFHEYSWRGVFPQKQVLGQVALLAFAFFLVFRKSISLSIVYIFLSLSMIFLSLSRTAWLVCVLLTSVVVFTELFRVLDRRITEAFKILILIIVIFFIFEVATNYVEFMTSLGKDATLTGRSTLWEYTLEVAKDHYLLGVGYKSFWLNQSDLIFLYFSYVAVNGHNFILDAYLEIGIVGCILMLLVFVDYFMKSRKFLDSNVKMFSSLMLVYIASVGQVATIFPNQNSIVTLVFFIFYSMSSNIKRNNEHSV